MTAPGAPADPSRPHRVRATTAGVLVVVASLLLPVGLAAVWLRADVVDTNAFVGTAGAVARDPAVQRDVSDKVSTALIDQLDVDANVRSAARSVLPDAAQGLAGPLAVATDTAIRRTTASVVASRRFEALWETAVRRAHENALLLAEGKPVAGVETRNGRIAVNLDPIVDAVVARLPGPIAALVPPVTSRDDIVLFRSSNLASAQPVVRAVDDGWWVVPLLSAMLFAAAILVASRRRRVVSWVGCGIVLTSIVAFGGVFVARRQLLDATDTRVGRAATRAVFDLVVDPFRTELWVAVGIGVALVAGALVTGYLRRSEQTDELIDEPYEPTQASPLRADPVLHGVEPTVAGRESMRTPDRAAAPPNVPAERN